MASSSPSFQLGFQQVPCSPNFVETVKYNSPVASVPDGDSSPLLGPAGRAGGKCETSYSYSPLVRHLLCGECVCTSEWVACSFIGEWVGKRARSSPPVCSSCKKIKLAVSNGREQVVPTGSPGATQSATEKKYSPPEYVKQLELFSGNDIFASKEE
ncbi:uncharacterized protein [Dysidea avara]|uniref:uncharacterized protein isoform X1 n=1 Tax=Dysidea avara TaxID=196820 RepID=UPI003332C204